MTNTTRIAQIDADIDELQRKVERFDRKQTAAKRKILELRTERRRLQYPAEPLSDVITFHKKFGGASSLLYKYAAIKAGGRWYATGALAPQAVTWEDLVDFARKDNVIDPAFIPRYAVPLPIANGTYTVTPNTTATL